MAHLLGAEGLHLEYPTHCVFDDVTVGINAGARIGILGRNGEGKSTLLGMLSGRITPDAGRVTQRSGVRVAALDQADTLNDQDTVATALVGHTPEHEWAGNPRIRDVIGGLVTDIDWHQPIAALSGGQRRRIQLAALLIGDWDVIALDEPTNHLDIHGITWLAEHLQQRWPHNAGGLLVVTHDRWFLDEVATTTWEIHHGDRGSVIEPFDGGYAAYVLQRVERDRLAAAADNKRRNLLRKELAWLRRGAPARTSKPKFRIEAANQLIADVPVVRDTVALAKAATARLGKDVIDILNVTVNYSGISGERTVLREIEWHIGPGQRIGILGANGAGKSTLLGVIAGTVTPHSGRVKQGKTVQLAMLDQQSTQLAELANDVVRDVLGRLKASYLVDGRELTPTQLLERLGFNRAQLSTRICDLSGGQRRRLQLMLTLLEQPNVLILDEPTNDVDIDMLSATEDLLDSWPGTLIVVSHDRYLLERVTDDQFAIIDGRVQHLPGGIDEYLRLTKRRLVATETSPQTKKPAPQTALSGAQIRSVQKDIAALDRTLAKLAEKVNAIHVQLAEHDHTDHVGITRLHQHLQELESELEAKEQRWLELSEMLE